MKFEELLGFGTGLLIAPAAALGSRLRGGRVVHKEGVVYRADVRAVSHEDGLAGLGQRVAGPAIMRLSSALWGVRREGWPDILGASIRLRRDATITPEAAPDDQDMLFATIPYAALTGAAMFTTEVHSFLWDDYYALGLFETPELGITQWRLASPRIPPGTSDRVSEVGKAIANGLAVFELQVREKHLGAPYRTVAAVELQERVDVDQEALRFSPFRNGRKIEARGFLNATRIAPYAASQAARPVHR